MKKAIAFRATSQVSDFLPMSRCSSTSFDGTQHTWNQSLAVAGCTINDLSFTEVHEIAWLLSYEAMGLADKGQGARLLEVGTVM